MNIRTCTAAFALLAGSALLACGGGGDSEQSYERFTQSQETTLDGDWEMQLQFVVARDVTAWQSFWQQRQATIDCTRDYNQPACSAAEPPVVDFARFTVVGGFAGNSCTFENPDDPVHVFSESNPSQLVVDVGWKCASGLGFGGPRANIFVLVHKTELPIVVR